MIFCPFVDHEPFTSPPNLLNRKLYPPITDEVVGIIPLAAVQQLQSNPPMSIISSKVAATSTPVNGCKIPITTSMNFGVIKFIFLCASGRSTQLPDSMVSSNLFISHTNGIKSILQKTPNVCVT